MLRKVLDARAQYAPDHPNARAALGKLHERLFTLVTTAPSLTLDVGSTQLSVGGHPLAKNVTEPDKLAQALFGDGARKIVFSRGLSVAQLSAFLEIAGRARHADSDQSVMTEFWEAELASIQFVVATTFAEDGSESLEVDSPGAQKSQREQVAGVMSVFTNPDLSASTGSDDLPTMISLSNAELEVLSATSLGDIDGKNLRAHDSSGRDALLAVDSETLHELRNRLAQPRADAGERLLTSLFDAAVTGPADLKPKVIAALQQTFESLLSTNRLEPCSRAIDHQLQLARADQVVAAQRLPTLNQLRQALAASAVVDSLLRALDAPEVATAAISLLRIVGGLCLDKIFDSLGKFKTEHGAQNVSKLLALLSPKADDLAARVKTATPEVAKEIVLLCNRQPTSIAAPLLSVLLTSPDAAIRRVAVRTVERSVALGMSALLRRMIGDPDREVRLLVVRLLAYAEDLASVEPMNRTLMRATTDPAERRELYRALGEIGGPAAADVLTSELNRQTDVEARIAIVNCFGHAWSPKAAAAVAELGGKLLGNPKLRQACKVAIAKAAGVSASGIASASGVVSASGVSSGSGIVRRSGVVSSPSGVVRSPSGVVRNPSGVASSPSGVVRQSGIVKPEGPEK